MKNKKAAIQQLFLNEGFDIDAANPAALRVMSNNFDYLVIIVPLMERDMQRGVTVADLVLKYDITMRQAYYYFNKFRKIST